jgi:EAL domain-containing protein (putative c-di-GMP-specific phosphodiesterase class I)
MYRAKRERLGFHVYERGAALADSRAGLRSDLRQALDKGGLTLLYQPKVDADSGAIVGLEALARWPHPERGLLTPDEFLPIAEQTGLILPLTLWVLGMCLRDQQRWRHEGHDLPVAVNISARWLRDAQFPGILRLLIRQMDGRPDRLVLEVTESGLMSDPERAAGVLSELAALGCRLSLDDFGSGQSSLPWLQRLSLHEIKIDRSIVASMAHDSNTAVIVRSIVRLAHGLGLRAVGEGVETEAIARALTALGCDELQGYLFGRPISAAAMSDRLRRAPAEASSVGVAAGSNLVAEETA